VAYRIKSGDTKPLDATLREGGTSGPAIPLVGATVRFRMRAVLGGPLLGGVCTLTDASAGKVRYVWQAGDLNVPGSYNAEFEITFGDGSIRTVPNDGPRARQSRSGKPFPGRSAKVAQMSCARVACVPWPFSSR
jgi:hypothetical protein